MAAALNRCGYDCPRENDPRARPRPGAHQPGPCAAVVAIERRREVDPVLSCRTEPPRPLVATRFHLVAAASSRSRWPARNSLAFSRSSAEQPAPSGRPPSATIPAGVSRPATSTARDRPGNVPSSQPAKGRLVNGGFAPHDIVSAGSTRSRSTCVSRRCGSSARTCQSSLPATCQPGRG